MGGYNMLPLEEKQPERRGVAPQQPKIRTGSRDTFDFQLFI